jgi:WD40 repeat protein
MINSISRHLVVRALLSLGVLGAASSAFSAPAKLERFEQEEESQGPELVLNTGGHTGMVTAVVFTPDSKRLISVSTDKTVRIWDVAGGECLKVLRPPIGTGSAGKLNAAALSPDGRWLAVGGLGAKTNAIYCIGLDGAELEVAPGHSDAIQQLAFAPDSRQFVSAGADGTIALWSVMDTSQRLREFRGHSGAVLSVAFSPSGKQLVSGGADKTVRIWDVTTKQQLSLMPGHQNTVATVAWSPSGNTIASGGFDAAIRLWGPEGKLRQTFPNQGNRITSVTFSSNSNELLYTRGGETWMTTCALLSVDNGQDRLRFDAHRNTVMAGALSADGALAATGGSGPHGGEIFIWSRTDGKIIQRLYAPSEAAASVAWVPEEKSIAWGCEKAAADRAFDTSSLDLVSQRTPQLTQLLKTPVTTLGNSSLAIQNATTLKLTQNSRIVRYFSLTKNDDQIRCFTFVGKDSIAVGGNFGRIYLFDIQSGRVETKFKGHTGDLIAMAPSPSGQYLLTSASDQTIKIWALSQDRPLLSLFAMGSDWIAWSADGYYASSPAGERLMGWHVNNGPVKLASFHSAAQFHDSLYRPDVIKRLLSAGSVAKALELADRERGKRTSQLSVTDVLPPFVMITWPDQRRTETTGPTVDIRCISKAIGKHPITAVKLLVDGRPGAGPEFTKRFDPPEAADVRQSWTVPLEPGSHTLAVQAESAVSKAVSEPVEVFSGARGVARAGNTSDNSPVPKPILPSLYVLAIGISQYPEKLKLEYAVKDAEAIAKTYSKNSLPLFNKVEVKLLTDQQATRRDILQGLTWLRRQMTQNDVAVISFAGHGAKDSDGTFYLLPIDGDLDDLLTTGVPGDQIKRTLAGIPGRFILLLDACHSGAVDGEKRRAGDSLTDDLVRDLVTDDYGVIVMCSAMGREFALESPTVEHGFFTLALVEGLNGKADYNLDSLIHLNEIDLYVTDRVKVLSEGKQHPVTARPTSIRSFPLTKP